MAIFSVAIRLENTAICQYSVTNLSVDFSKIVKSISRHFTSRGPLFEASYIFDARLYNPDPVLIPNLDPDSNPDPIANPDPVANLDPVGHRSDCRIRVGINSVTNPDGFSYWMAIMNPDPVKKSGHYSGSGYDSGSSFKTGSSYKTGSKNKSSYGSGAGPEFIYKSGLGTRSGSGVRTGLGVRTGSGVETRSGVRTVS
jgi:hypothetical protein